MCTQAGGGGGGINWVFSRDNQIPTSEDIKQKQNDNQ